MTTCPSCHEPMRVWTLAAHQTLAAVQLDACERCRLLWFDGTESLSLAPHSVVTLLRVIAESASRPQGTLATAPTCPRCSKPLALTHDLQRTTRFIYWRCAQGHGRLIGFAQFLREKNFVREPSRAELEKLRATVRQIACSQCGAPVHLARDTACTHCGSPIAFIDPDGVAKALEALDEAGRRVSAPDAEALRRQLAEAQAAAVLEASRTRASGEDWKLDLLGVGAGGLAGAIARWLARR